MNTLLALSALVQTLSWQQIDLKQYLNFDRDVVINRCVTLKKGSHVQVDNIMSLDPIAVTIYQMSFLSCTDDLKTLETDIEIIDETYGIKLNTGCQIEIFVENKDLEKPSWFKP